MHILNIIKPEHPQIFGGAGFHNNDATMYHCYENDHFEQYLCKCYREASPGFMRTFAGFSDWTKEAMDLQSIMKKCRSGQIRRCI